MAKTKFRRGVVYKNYGIDGIGRSKWTCTDRKDNAICRVILVSFVNQSGKRVRGRVKVIDGVETCLCSHDVFSGRIVASLKW